MNKIILFYVLFFLTIIGCNNNLQKKEKLNSELLIEQKGYLKIDSIKINNITIDYKLFFYLKGNRWLISKIRNQDNSIIFKKKFSVIKRNFNYDCYEVNDLTTGLLWNFLHNKNNDEIFETEKYDLEAVGDTLDRNKVNFDNHTSVIFSSYYKKSYLIQLKKIEYLKD
jgi:hypothetical protein